MTKVISSILLALLPLFLLAQLGNNGALISVKSGAMMSVHEDVVNYNGGEFHNTDTIYLFDDWQNDAGNEAFISNGIGIVYLYGADQRIKGNDITRFYDLRLTQTGVKYGDLDVYVDGFLRFNDRQFHLDVNTVHVFNPDVNAVENIGFGYLSALNGGGLLRHTNTAQSYFYPLGWTGGYYRPLTLTMEDSDVNEFKGRMAFTDATSEGWNRGLREATLCEVNPVYYHQIFHENGTTAAKIKLEYNEAVDGEWNTITHWQNVPRWEDVGDEVSGIDAVSGLEFHETVDYVSDFLSPAFALGNESDSLELIASDTVICQGESVTFSTEAGLVFYEFFQNGVSVQSGTSNTYTTSNISDGDIFSLQASSNECQYVATEVIMTVNPLPVASPSSNSPVCIGETVELYGNGDSSWNYQWTGPLGFTSNIQNPLISNAQVNQSGMYMLTVMDGNGCSSSYQIPVLVSEYPDLTSSITSPVCEGSAVSLQTTFNSSWDYFWQGPLGYEDSIANPIIEEVFVENAGEYVVTAINGSGCITRDTVELEVFESVMATSYGDTTIYQTTSAPIGITYDSTYTYVWNPTGTLTCSTCPNPTASPMEDTAYEVLVTTENGCIDTFAVTVNVLIRTDEGLIVPNTITPNGDGYNDTWVVPFLDRFDDNQVVIVNRWGDEVFQAKPYENDFDGNYEGRNLPDGTYYYILILGEDFGTLKGSLTIIRE